MSLTAIRGAFVCALVTALVACSNSSTGVPTGPPSSPSNNSNTVVSQVYSGHYRMTSCGDCGAWQGRFWRFSLTLTRADSTGYSATLRSEPWNLESTLTGVRRADGAIVMQGTAGPVSSTLVGATVSDFVVFEDAVRGLHGSFRYVTQHTHGAGATYVAEIDSASIGPAAPVSPASIVGAWAGTAKNDRTCTGEICNADPQYSLVVAREGSGYRAHWDLAENPRAALLLYGTEVGDSIVFTGRFAGANGLAPDGDLDVQRLAVRIAADGTLTGEFDYVGRTSVSTPRLTGVLTGERRVTSFLPGPFQGEWRGDYVSRTCVGDCSVFRVATHVVRLTLAQAGSQIVGSYGNQTALTGTANGQSVVLEGEEHTPNCTTKQGGPCSTRIRIVVTGVDEWGVMSGTLTFIQNGRVESSTSSGELFRMVRQIR